MYNIFINFVVIIFIFINFLVIIFIFINFVVIIFKNINCLTAGKYFCTDKNSH